MSVFKIKMAQKVRKRERRARSILLAILVIAICLLLVGLTRAGERTVSGYEYATTDTLWGLLEYCPEDMDRWKYINTVMELNGMSDMTVHPDRLYQVPVYGGSESSR